MKLGKRAIFKGAKSLPSPIHLIMESLVIGQVRLGYNRHLPCRLGPALRCGTRDVQHPGRSFAGYPGHWVRII